MARRVPGRSELQEALQRLGARRVEGALVAALSEAGALGTRELVERTGLRQPEVSVGIQVLRDRSWVETETVPRQGKGRPMHRYRLLAPPVAIRRHYEEEGRRAIANLDGAVQVLKRRLG